jgi:hypothetical protein
MVNATLVTEEPEGAVVRGMAPIVGLCRDCLRAEQCTFPRDPFRPVWSCDEFLGAGRALPCPERSLPASVGEPPGETAEVKGLCRGCANRPTCTYPKPAGGVWHCDELA